MEGKGGSGWGGERSEGLAVGMGKRGLRDGSLLEREKAENQAETDAVVS